MLNWVYTQFFSIIKIQKVIFTLRYHKRIAGFSSDSKSVRSHSLFQSERLVDDFYNCGLSHISNCFIPHGTGINVQPFSLWNGMIMVPHCWQDNVALKMNLSFPENGDYEDSYQMFNFHPIHVFKY